MTRLTAKDRPGREVQVVISRVVVAKTQRHTGQAQVMVVTCCDGCLTSRAVLYLSPATALPYNSSTRVPILAL